MAIELYGRDARAITFEDVCNCLQYTPQSSIWIDGDYCYNDIGNTTTKINEWFNSDTIQYIGKYYPDKNSPSGYSLDETAGTTIFGNMILDGCFFNLEYLEGSTATEKRVIIGDLNQYGGYDNPYWLATVGKVQNPVGEIAFGVGHCR